MNRTFSITDDHVRLGGTGVHEPFTIIMLADTHLSQDDERGIPFRDHTARMAAAHQTTTHVRTGEPTNPEAGLVEALEAARACGAEMVALAGDILSFPSEAAVELAVDRLRASGIDWLYTAGNHDWHYEGMEGTRHDLRTEWTQRRLLPLHRGDDPLMAVRELHGTRLVAISNGTYEITPEQLAFFQEQVATGEPLLLFVHIPFYSPGRGLGFGCGHPDWGAHSDTDYIEERRERWREGGHTETTMSFYRTVFEAPTLLGVFAGHTHRRTLDVIGGIPQVVTAANAAGAYLQVDIHPA